MTAYVVDERESHVPGIAIVALVGELDLTNAHELAERLGISSRPEVLVVNLSGVTFVDSAALHQLFLLVRDRGRGRVAYVLEPTSPIAATIRIVGLERVATVEATLDDALRGLVPAAAT
jgi:anti-sigma B factor antagonist